MKKKISCFYFCAIRPVPSLPVTQQDGRGNLVRPLPSGGVGPGAGNVAGMA